MTAINQMGFELARAEGHEAMTACAEKADRVSPPGWTGLAYVFLVKFAIARKRSQLWTAEDVTDAFASDLNFVQPHDQRAWGAVFQKALRKGVLEVVDHKGKRHKGHGVTGAARYRTCMHNRLAGEVL